MNLFTRRQKRTQVIPQRALNHTEFMRLYKEGYNDIQMSEYFGITIIKAIRFRDSLDLSPNFNKMQIPKIVKGTKKSLVRYGIEMSAFNALYNTGADDNDLSEIFQITKCAVRSIRHEFKYKMNQKRVLTTAERYKLLFDSGLSVDEICTIHNISQDTVRGWAHKLGYKKAYLNDTNDKEPVDVKFEPDSESLFCDTEFLKSFFNKKLKSAKKECED